MTHHSLLKLTRFALPALLGVVLAIAACTPRSSSVPEISAQEAMGEIRNDFAVLVDVREESELKEEGLAAQALWFPTSKIESDPEAWKAFVAKLPREKRVVFYCKAGGRAGKAAAKLAAEGFKTGNMGSFQDWVKAGLPTRRL